MDQEPASWRNLPNAPPSGTRLCQEDFVPDGECRLIQQGESSDQGDTRFSLIVLHSGNEWRAYANRCPHFGVGLAQKQEHLIYESGISLTCNVHYSRFRWQDGLCDRGDCAGDSLLAIPIACREGWIVIA